MAVEQIIVEYDGAYADKMSWQEDKLARFAGLSDLRTQVYIRRGLARPQSSYTELTDVLAWKRILDPASIFRLGNHEEQNPRSDIRSNLATASSVLFINDQVLIQNNKDRNNGNVNEREFVGEVDSLVNGSLRGILNIEKFYQGKWGLLWIYHAWNRVVKPRWGSALIPIIGGYPTGLISMKLGGDYFLGNLAQNKFGEFTPYLHGSLIGLGTFLLGGSIYLSVRMFSFYKRIAQIYFGDEPSPLAPYQLTTGDFNPLKHAANLALGNMYLSTWGRRLIEYKL